MEQNVDNRDYLLSEELEQMRLEYAGLKERLERQEITNEKLILASIRKDMRIVRGKTWISVACGVAALANLPLICFSLGLRIPFIIISIIWITAMVAGNVLRNREIGLDRLWGESTRNFLSEIKKRKAQQFRWVRVNITLFVVWTGYFVGECAASGMERETLIFVIAGVVTGAVIGVAMGLRMHNRIIGAYEGIILELENPEASHTIL